ncbi:MAG: porin family protein [Bacteroidota bacterium]
MKKIIFLFAFLFGNILTQAQGFHFGAQLSGILSQIEGDKLNGFNRAGYSFGLIGGFTFNETHALIINPQYAFFGSKKNSEKFSNEVNQLFIELGLSTINFLGGYSFRFGDTWTEEKKYRINAGLRIHRKIKSDVNIIRTSQAANVTFDEDEDLKDFFMCLEFGAGINLPRNFGLELSYSHSLQNILKNQKGNITKLVPFHLSLGLNYYIFK